MVGSEDNVKSMAWPWPPCYWARGGRQSVVLTEAQRVISSTMTEKALQAAVIDGLQKLGWMVYHTWNSKHSEAGFPDIVAVRNGRIIVAECKAEKGKPTPAQVGWLGAFGMVPGVAWCGVLRPGDWMAGALDEAMVR